ncbi:hypothetical protein BCR41DRAFT_384590 [Lobosporangium transversale]|uniref:G-protein coupled receptors family 2 profile 2 domain-containing protein n=1 Tax=Lobosporangium transversale TaxID=64571 RepID=A0A1Y2GW43_9FUNG|nr:hypothetical protein BCR41DRAFT_384590 [Lobosporangium transversale]ORZ26530.1 hypothetical protein BCR41DRAFT_384590 [Lobosporangium transversale]|eukprot:XP_021884295.1 hypothetical protein BCR41DRAFT_384590 [Lobosporangium transversale]
MMLSLPRRTLTLCALLAAVTFTLAQQSISASTITMTADVNTTTPTTNFFLPTSTPPSLPPSISQPSPPAPGQGTHICPGPLIPNTHNLSIQTCMEGCCIKCPAVNSFYEPNKVENVLYIAYVTRQVSLVFAVFMALSYLLLPGKRSQPHISVLFLTVSLSLWYVSFDIMPGISNACINEFEHSTGQNSKLCGIQGVLIIYFTQTCSLWCSLLIYKLHMLAVWRSDIIDRYYGWLTGFCWIFPLAFAIPVAVKNLSQYPGIGFSCLVSTENLNTYLFYPIAIYIYPGILAHAFTVAKMVHLAILTSNLDAGLSELSSSAKMRITTTMQAKRLLRGQWRPALMVGTVLASLTVFWLFYFIEARRLAQDTDWIAGWLECVNEHGKKMLPPDEVQTICAKVVASHLPSIPWFTVAEMLLAVIGIIVALVFITKAEFWSDWGFLLSNILSRGKLGKGNRGQRSHDGVKPPDMERPRYNNPSSYQYNDPNIKKGVRVGYNDTLPDHLKGHNGLVNLDYSPHSNQAAQQHNMDDLFDKEYGLPETDLQRNLSYGSKADIASTSLPSTEPPHYLTGSVQNPHLGDILGNYSSAQENKAWTIDTQTLTNPVKAYLVANDSSDRYVDQPVVPLPVPRASIKTRANHQQASSPIFLSSPTHSPMFAQTSLSPMPPKPSNQLSMPFAVRQSLPDSATSVQPQPSPIAPAAMTTSAPPTSTNMAFYNWNDSTDKIMVASRESISGINGRVGNGGATAAVVSVKGSSKTWQKKQSPDSVKRNNSTGSASHTKDISNFYARGRPIKTPSTLDLRTKSLSPPAIPRKSPARQNSLHQRKLSEPNKEQQQKQLIYSTPISVTFLPQTVNK